LLLALACLSCSREDGGAAVGAVGGATADLVLPDLPIPSLPPEDEGEIEVSSLSPIGEFILPSPIKPGAATELSRRFSSPLPLEKLIEFYGNRGYVVVRNEVGATVHPLHGDGLLQILPGPRRTWQLVVVPRTREPEPEPAQAPLPTGDPAQPAVQAEARKALEQAAGAGRTTARLPLPPEVQK
jgi:hypothetical protein